MKISQDFKCFIGAHKYVINKEETMIDVRGNTIGTIIVSRCTNCGKIKLCRIIQQY